MKFLNNIFYMYSNLDGSSQILLFLIILVVLMLISIGIINLIIKKRNEKYDREFNPIDRYTKIQNKKEKKSTKENINIVKNNITVKNDITKEEKIIEKPKEEKEEVEILEDPEIIEVVSEDNSIDKISRLLEDNLSKQNEEIDLTRYEMEEEKDAIISYDELVRRAGAKKIIYKTEPQTISEVKKEEKIEIKPENNDNNKTKFQASKIISPIYGVRKEEKKQDNELEEFIDLESIKVKKSKEEEEMMKDMTFLQGLKTFRSNLD